MTWMPARPDRPTGAPSTQVGGTAHSAALADRARPPRATAGAARSSANTRSWTGTEPAREKESIAAYASSAADSVARAPPDHVTA